MKVLVAGTGGGFVSGISTVADQHERLLRSAGHEVVRVVAGDRPRRRPNGINLENLVAVVGDAVAVARAARRQRAQVIWYHTFGVPTLPAARALLVAAAGRLAGADVVVHLHAFGLEEHVAGGGRPLAAVLRAIGRLSAGVVTEHDSARRSLAPFVPPTKLHVLPNWVEVPEVPAPLPSGPPWHLVFVGGLVARKGGPQLIETMRLLADDPVTLRFVGGAGEDGPEALARLHQQAADLVSAGRVSFAGELGPAAVRGELRQAHLLVLPSNAEGSPLAVIEAMAEGRPVLVSDAGDLPAVVGRAGAGRVVELPGAQDPPVIAEAVRDMLRDPSELRAMGARAAAYVAKHHSEEAARVAIDAVLERVAPSEGGRARG